MHEDLFNIYMHETLQLTPKGGLKCILQSVGLVFDRLTIIEAIGNVKIHWRLSRDLTMSRLHSVFSCCGLI